MSRRIRLYELAAGVLKEAEKIAEGPDTTLVECTVARLAVHRVRADLDDRAGAHQGPVRIDP